MFVFQTRVKQPKIGDEAKVMQRGQQEIVRQHAPEVRETHRESVKVELVEKKSLERMAVEAAEKAAEKAAEVMAWFGTGVAFVGGSLMVYAMNAGIAGLSLNEALMLYQVGQNIAAFGTVMLMAGGGVWAAGKAWQWWEGRNADGRKSE